MALAPFILGTILPLTIVIVAATNSVDALNSDSETTRIRDDTGGDNLSDSDSVTILSFTA
jgi:hypothetical protein